MKKLIVLVVVCFVFFGISTAFGMSATPVPEKPYCETKYPIMLVPGVSGFDTLIGFVDYWYQIPKNMEKDGAVVRCTSLSAVASTELRGEQLLAQVEEFLAETGAEKVNLIGHSHGTTTSRYVAAVRPDLVASVTAIAGVHKGTPLADAFVEYPQETQDLLVCALNIFGEMFNILGGYDYEQDAAGLMKDFMDGGKAFNDKYPCAGVPVSDTGEGAYSEIVDGNRIYYYSWTGNEGGMTNVLDPVDLLFVMTGQMIDNVGNYEHDGLVTVNSSRFGKVISEDYAWNHLDEINMMFGLRKPFSACPITVMRKHANRLQKEGL